MTHSIALPDDPRAITLVMPKRRALLIAAACLPAMSLLPASSIASSFWDLPRELILRRHTKSGFEEIKAIYWADGELVESGYRQLCMLLRDLRAKEAEQAVQMDVVLLDILRGIQGWFLAAGISRPIIINSGYRTRHTNGNTEGAARNSMHIYGKAADFWMEGVSAEYLAKLGLYLQGGGVGYYASKGFVHVDTGRLRSWRG